MTNNLTWSETKLGKEIFKKAIEIVEKYLTSGKTIADDRYIYPNYPNTEIAFEYWRYKEMKNRWDKYISRNKKEPVYIYIKPPAVDISGDDKILPIDTFLDMEKRVTNYLAQGGTIDDTRRIYLKMSEQIEYITYTKYKDLLSRVQTYRKTNNRDPTFIYIITQSNENTTTRIAAVGDDITPNSSGWYICKRCKTAGKDIKQPNGYFCGPNATKLTYYEISGIFKDIYHIARIEGTTTNGTDHNGITKGFLSLAKEDGITVNVDWEYFSDIGFEKLGKLVKDLTKGILQHSRYKYRYGHYEYIIGVNPTTRKLMIANSLSGGWIEYRSFSVNKGYLDLISQKSICIAEKE